MHIPTMYRQEKPLILMSTASAIPNNLAVDQMGHRRFADQVAVIHPGYISIIPIDCEEQKTKYVAVRSSAGEAALAQVSQVMWCKLGNEVWFIIASTLGIQVFDSSAEKCFFSHPCRDGLDSAEVSSPQLATIGSNLLCVGMFVFNSALTHIYSIYGYVSLFNYHHRFFAWICFDLAGCFCLLFQFPGNNVGSLYIFHLFDQQSEAVLVQNQRGHKYGISAIAGPSDQVTDDVIASGDQDGNVVVWAVNRDHLHKDATFSSYGFACTSIHIWHKLIVVAYGSGHIRLFSIHPTAAMLVEVAAHARWITALDLAPDSGRLLSVGEDSLVRVWQIREEQPMIEHRFHSSIKDSMLVGGRFLTSNGSAFCVSSYDSCEVHCFHIS
ncbi:WD repeat-containing protein 54-like isoform X2 [Frankliniella occidentalis]|uniref:WD repeat-containing protein 54-like isoform X2 n=1 Tax=Frankliniella occidentalis TaxID=133901 RepID=A0A9C6U6V6_FRAOC|nr:WD repeat-containing protein 54-like isoform X2 [Frankliniella occidentalis]